MFLSKLQTVDPSAGKKYANQSAREQMSDTTMSKERGVSFVLE
jgi:hypothetical protein